MAIRLPLHLKIICVLLILLTLSPLPVQARNALSIDRISFAQFGQAEIILNGPYDTAESIFNLPADWQWDGVGQLVLNMNSSNVSGSTLKVLLNEETVGTLSFNENGQISRTIEIHARPAIALKLGFSFENPACLPESQSRVVIQPDSMFILEHKTAPMDTSLLAFPHQIYQDSIHPDAALLVIPNSPSADELQAALTVAAGLGRLTGNKLALDLVRIGDLTMIQRYQNHLILIGRVESLPLLNKLILPMPVIDGDLLLPDRYEFERAGQADGVIQMIASPTKLSRVILIVSGSTDAAVIKAAQALSTGILRPNVLPNAAIVKEVQAAPVASRIDPEQIRYPLNSEIITFQPFIEKPIAFDFHLPTHVEKALLEISFSYSQGLDLAASEIAVYLNGVWVNSLSLATATESKPLALPVQHLRVGTNRLELRGNLIPLEKCAALPERYFLTIWPETRLLLDFAPENNISSFDLRHYPAAFVADPALGSTAFVLQCNDPFSWRKALEIAGFLGARAQGEMMIPRAFYADEFPIEQRAGYNLLLVGRAGQLPLIYEIRDSLPAPFDQYSDRPNEIGLPVIFRVSYNDPVGYLEQLPSPWNPEKTVTAALGNTEQGVDWAAEALTHSGAETGLTGNFAVLSFGHILTANIQPKDATQPNESLSTQTNRLIPAPLLFGGLTVISVFLVILVSLLWRRSQKTG